MSSFVSRLSCNVSKNKRLLELQSQSVFGRLGTVHRSCYHWLAKVIFTSRDHKLHWHPDPIPRREQKSCAIDLRLISQSSAEPEMVYFSVGSEAVFLSGTSRWCLLEGPLLAVPCWWSPWFQLQKGQNFGSLVLKESVATNLRLLVLAFFFLFTTLLSEGFAQTKKEVNFVQASKISEALEQMEMQHVRLCTCVMWQPTLHFNHKHRDALQSLDSVTLSSGL